MRSVLVLFVLCVAAAAAANILQPEIPESKDIQTDTVAAKIELLEEPTTHDEVEESEDNAVAGRSAGGPIARSGFCPMGWHNFQGSCYRLLSSASTWQVAERTCISYGATLLSVQNRWEEQYLQQLLSFGPVPGGMVWVGGYYFQNRWGWVDGKNFDFLSWFTGSSPTKNSCLVMSTSGGWRADPCNKVYHYICERSSFC